ncbi:Glycosyl transferases group 1 [Methylobacterium sp. 174MFSha1.1]|uniref:glycosyltransferase n=1 Tax=Methylobacterium sp. 174MFSha1.1 TaxID=1502749 RepID=UPI0008E6D567|nr:glycosyltransferase [Methylobacterium sp. 174MFSha1.1]SFU75761.1 Glycosyl transferases group 1 [Methylobacterium sp. 174MFSha1.1]
MTGRSLRSRLRVTAFRRPAEPQPHVHPLFDAAWYLDSNPDVRAAGIPAYEHYLVNGWREGRWPNAYFDEAWYVRTYPEVARSPRLPIDHYLHDGARLGYDPSPDFFSRWYLYTNPDVARAGINPLQHFLAHGRAEGRRTRPAPAPVGPAPDARAPEDVPIHDTETALDQAARRALDRLAPHAERHGPFASLLLLPLFGRGGGEKVALSFAQVLRVNRPDRSVLIVATDRDQVEDGLDAPQGCLVLGLSDLMGRDPALRPEDRLRRLIVLMRPRLLHIVNADLGWRVLRDHAGEIDPGTLVVASLFCIQRDPASRRPVGIAADHFAQAAAKTAMILTDNRAVIDDLDRYFPGAAPAGKLRCLYAPHEWRPVARVPVAGPEPGGGRPRGWLSRLVGGRRGGRPRFLWASRLDRQKRVELLLAIARQMSDCAFVVFGQAVTDGDVAWAPPSNVTRGGPFSDPATLLAAGPFDAFIYTTYEDGLPNILLEIGRAGLPVVAPAIGGIAELIGFETGVLLPAEAGVPDYEAALRQILREPGQAAARAEALRELVLSRHAFPAFAAAVAALPGYLEHVPSDDA